MTDTHCHLSFSQFDPDRAAVRDRAARAGVARLINPGTDLPQSRAAVAMAEKYENVWAAVGVHPQDIGGLTPDAFEALAELAHHPRVVAIGEVGLELHHRAGALAPQVEWLERFVELAVGAGKPLIFHVRNAHAEFRHFLEQRVTAGPRVRGDDGVGGRSRGVIHAFSGTADDARFYAARGLLLGITGVATFPNAVQLRLVVQDVPLDSLLLETDAPFLAPQSHRGKRNEPAYLREIAEQVADLKGTTVDEVEQVTDANAARLFGLPGGTATARAS